jgi:hypothetical protein
MKIMLAFLLRHKQVRWHLKLMHGYEDDEKKYPILLAKFNLFRAKKSSVAGTILRSKIFTVYTSASA